MWATAFLAAAWADEPTEPPAPEPPAPESATPDVSAVTEVSVGLAGNLSLGNTVGYLAQADAEVVRASPEAQVRLSVDALSAQVVPDADRDGRVDSTERADGFVETSRRIDALARVDRLFGARSGVYVLAGSVHDPFAGLDARSHLQLGGTYALAQGRAGRLFVELGADAALEDRVAGVVPGTEAQFGARGLVGAQVQSPRTRLDLGVEVIDEVARPENVRVQGDASLVGMVTQALGLTLGYQLRFDNVPVPDFRGLDQVALVGVQLKTAAGGR